MSKLLKLLLTTALVNSLTWIIIIPLWQYPDEQAHFAQVQNIAETGKTLYGLNTSQEIMLSEKILQTERDNSGNNKYVYHPEFKLYYSKDYYGPEEFQLLNLSKGSRKTFVNSEATTNPPLYYFLSAQVYKLFSNTSLITRVFAIRIFSSVLFLLLIWVAYIIGKQVYPQNSKYPLVVASVISFLPMLVFSSTGILPDPLTNLLFSLLILFSLKILTSGISKKIMLLILVTIILGTLTRQHILIALPIVLVPFAYRLLKIKGGYKAVVIAFLLISSFIYLSIFNSAIFTYPVLNNFRIPDATNMMNLTILFRKELFEHFAWTLNHTYHEVLPWFWGIYKWLSLALPINIYRLINLLTVISIVGIIWHFLKVIKKKKLLKADLSLIFFVVSIGIYFLSFTIWDYFFRMRNNYSFGIQGRYFFPLIIPIMLLIITGLKEIIELPLKRYSKYIPIFLIGLVILFNDYSLIYVAKSYYSFSNIGDFIMEVSQYKPIIFKGSIIFSIILTALIFQLLFIFSLGKATLKAENESS